MRTPASKSAAMLTKIMATRYVCFVTYFFYVHLLSYTCKLSQSSLKLCYHIDNNLFLQYRMSTGLDFSTQSPCCGWVTQLFACGAATSIAVDEEERKPTSITAMNFGSVEEE